MEDKKFLKHLNILYVEDEKLIREKTTEIFELTFNQVFVASNGLEALELFLCNQKNNFRLDAIITDINMPEMNGIEFLKEVRKHDEDIPLFLCSAYIENQYLFDSLKVNVFSYFTKPVNFEKLFRKLIKACQKFHYNDTIKKQKVELEKYLDAINSTAIISKTDVNGIITYVNDIFCQTSKYNYEELIGQKHNIIRHPDNPKTIFTKLWKNISVGKTWKGKLKNRAKDGSTYYVNTTIIPVFDDDFTDEIVEFIGIRFLTTEDEIQKREFRKNVLKNIQEMNKKKILLKKEIEFLKGNSFLSNQTLFDKLQKEKNELEKKSLRQYKQILHFEKEIKELRSKNQDIIKLANIKIKSVSNIIDTLKQENKKLQNNLDNLNMELEKKDNLLKESQEQINFKQEHIATLNDVIYYKQKTIDNLNI